MTLLTPIQRLGKLEEFDQEARLIRERDPTPSMSGRFE